MPTPVGRHEANTEPAHESRKLVTVLFADLEGSTQLGEMLDIEPLRALLTEFFEAMASVLVEWGGQVEKYIGDAVVAVFGVPDTHEDDAVRALRAGLEMQDRLDVLNPSFQERFGVDLAMRIGVNTGEVLATTEADAVLAGDVFNVAARIEGIAEPGTVVVSERTYLAAEGAFDFDALGQFALKGKSESEAVWHVTGRRLAIERPSTSEMVGRAAELGMLVALMEQAIAGGRPRLVTVIGDAGIGKSRLVREFVLQQTDEVRWFVGRCLAYGHGITFWPLRELLWEAAGISMDDTSQEAGSKLHDLVEALPGGSVEDPSWLAFALATTAGIALPDNPFDDLSPESAGEELQLAWPAFASALASAKPTVLVIEDIHWGERPLLDMIEQLALRALGPLLVVATARPEFMQHEAGWGARAIPSQISLGPLVTSSFGQLMEQLMPGIDDAVRHRLLDSAGGNPFFAEEIARHALDEGHGGILSSDLLVPDTARAVLASRIDQLSPRDREVLEDASVVGETFWSAPLEMVGHQNLADSLATLERGGFITTRPVTSLHGQREMAFRHGLMRDVAYQSISRRRLGPIHAAVAEWTEALASDRREEYIEMIAHHYATAAQLETSGFARRDDRTGVESVRSKAVEALVDAGVVARRRFSIDQAVEYADRGLALNPSDRLRLKALELKADSYHAAARVDEAWPVYVEAITLARKLGDEADISRVITEATLLWSRYGGAFTTEEWKPAAVEVVQTRLAEIGEDEESLELAALLTGRSVWGRRKLFERTPEEVRRDAERAISISESLDSQKLLSHALDAYEMCLREEGFCDLGDLADRMVKLGSEMVDRRQAHEMLITSAIALTEVGRYEYSREVGQTAHADAQAMGVHQRIHGITARTSYMVPNGMFGEFLDESKGLLELVTEDGGQLCDFGGGAMVGRALALFENDRAAEGNQTVDFFSGALPDITRIPIVELQFIERVRPFLRPKRLERLLRSVDGLSAPVHHLYSIRARLPIAVLRSQWPDVEEMVSEARTLAKRCCAPEMLAFADWAEAVREGSVSKSRTALEDLSEPYTAARLAVDALLAVPSSDEHEFRAATEKTLESMGAQASLAQLRGTYGLSDSSSASDSDAFDV